MSRIDIGGIGLNVRQWGDGPVTIVFIHGNLACGAWFELVPPLLDRRFRIVAADWRGCGLSDKPEPDPDYANYTIARHAEDVLGVIDALGLGICHLATHSTGGLIGLYMLLAAPERFAAVLALDPVGPRGLRFPPEALALFDVMKASRDKTRKGLALTASTLFRPGSLEPGAQPVFAGHASAAQRDLFERLVEQTFAVSDGIWYGTPFHLNAAGRSTALGERLAEIRHPHLVLWGALDPFVPRADVEEMAARLPDCRLIVVPDVGHSLLLERPEVYAAHFRDFLGARGTGGKE
jgi:pimeloyl-ACP methyl ester carboxylesterase